MSLVEKMKENYILLDRTESTKQEVIAAIASAAAAGRELSAYREKDIAKALEDREKLGTTGFGGGIAIPHCSLEKAEDFVVGLYVHPEGVDFNAIDGKPVHLMFFIVGPSQERNTHILLLSAVSKILQQKESKTALKQARTPAGVYTAIGRYSKETEESKSEEKSLFHVIVQREDFFEDILQIFSSVPDSSVSVIETSNAGKYLNRLPLFSALWTAENSSFNSIIIAVVAKSKCNDVIRRIHMISDDIGSKPGVLITVHELTYAGGSIEL